ncbi:hypothetical protein B0A50_05659 [Salinomyces thailandicus]|uniref:Uncharacterized protein n=1 Tax=Salinomyces thailandicus TaxID=706561 RepID=A0A4U0TUJ3_9PEZI|nr:hypothetical protein B0A50_05659 [Salinomyces thailandica]
MAGFAGADLAMAVTSAGGLGFIGAFNDMPNVAQSLDRVEQNLERYDGVLPIGVGFLTFVLKSEAVMPILSKYRPAVVWLFASQELDDYAEWARLIRAATPQSQVWIQLGSVAAALQVAQRARPDAICVQGSDAGGHGFEQSAGIISLLPEVGDALAAAGLNVPLLASGGMADGRGAAAALALGAQGVVMGTRFLAASETNMHREYRKAILAAREGGVNTIRAKLFDELRGPNMWPKLYDGRSIVMASWNDHLSGMSIEEIRRLHAEAVKVEDRGFAADGKGRAAIWAGTGVGLVKEEQAAAEIAEQVRNEAVAVLAKTRSML